MPGQGKRGTAPCGHAGEHLVANYVRCLEGCEDLSACTTAKKRAITQTDRACEECGSDDMQEYPAMWHDGRDVGWCKRCLHVNVFEKK